ncbi:MAG: presqualene diphosphate synthase HpnD [Rhodospirillales bacterium]
MAGKILDRADDFDAAAPAAALAPGLSDADAEAHVTAVTKASGTSFYWAMRILPPERRLAMFAIYAFCREVDDIADDPAPARDKRERLDAWRAEIDRVYGLQAGSLALTARALARAVRDYGLAREDFHAVIDGMEMDVNTFIRAPSLAELETYCNRVAGAVGLLSIRVFGATEPQARDFALALGTALQLTNILRDLRQDAEMGRLYLPREMLVARGIASDSPDEVLRHPALPAVCRDVAALARTRYREADAARAACRPEPLRPAVVMMKNYQLVLERLCLGGWRDLDAPVRVSKPAKLWIAFRYGILHGLG